MKPLVLLMRKINTHFFHSVKRLETLSLGRTVCFFADQVAQLSNIPDYFQYPKLRLSDDCPHCCKIIKRIKVVPLASSTSQSKRRGFLRPLCIRSTTAGLKEHAQSTRNCGPCQGEKFGSP